MMTLLYQTTHTIYRPSLSLSNCEIFLWKKAKRKRKNLTHHNEWPSIYKKDSLWPCYTLNCSMFVLVLNISTSLHWAKAKFYFNSSPNHNSNFTYHKIIFIIWIPTRYSLDIIPVWMVASLDYMMNSQITNRTEF
jgi:hypothetical protein